jgi:hypothetical protein
MIPDTGGVAFAFIVGYQDFASSDFVDGGVESDPVLKIFRCLFPNLESAFLLRFPRSRVWLIPTVVPAVCRDFRGFLGGVWNSKSSARSFDIVLGWDAAVGKSFWVF